jgi:hypothetical protein
VTEPAEPYRVVYSERVRQRLRMLADEAAQRGDGEAFAAALKEFHRRLTIYPQFGDPLLDLTEGQGQIRTAIIRPLALRYGVHEDRRLVLVVALPVLLPMSGPGSASD